MNPDGTPLRFGPLRVWFGTFTEYGWRTDIKLYPGHPSKGRYVVRFALWSGHQQISVHRPYTSFYAAKVEGLS
jgi:hypothetical protein